MEKVIIIGAGPCGLSAAVELKRRNIDPLILDKGCLLNSVYRYPTNMHFFSTPELLEIGGVPFMTQHEKPTRQEALNYYRTVAGRGGLRVRTYEQAVAVTRLEGGGFRVETRDRYGETLSYEAQYVVVATGYFDNPNMLGIPGEQLPKVSHYYKDAHPYQGMKVVVVGGKNSAVEAAMELERTGAEVTMVYRGDKLTEHVKAWVRPVIESLLAKGRIRMLYRARLTEVTERTVTVDTEHGAETFDNDFVFALTGFHPDHKFLSGMGVRMDERTGAPDFDAETMETNVDGLYVAGVLAAGFDANVIFIENGRLHGGIIAEHIATRQGQ